MSRQILENCSDWLNGKGIVKALTDNYDVPWAQVLDGQSLDDDYYGNRSGTKLVSPLVDKLLNSDGELTDANLNRLAKVIYNKYGAGWDKAYAALYADYNPIENYNMTETETPAGTTKTITPAQYTEEHTPAEVKEEHTPAHTKETYTPPRTIEEHTPAHTLEKHTPAHTFEDVTPAETTNTTRPANYEEEMTINGFNSATAVDANGKKFKGDDEHKGTDQLTVQKKGTTEIYMGEDGEELTEFDVVDDSKEVTELKLSEDGEGVTEFETVQDGEEVTQNTVMKKGEDKFKVDVAGSEVYTTQTDRELTRSGNVGVTTSQQMISSEIDLRQAYNLMDALVFPDIDKVMVLNLYGG